MPEPRVALLTREYPPEVYGGAGVHVEYLARELARLVELTVHAGEPSGPHRRPASQRSSPTAPGTALAGPEPYRAALQALSVDLAMAAGTGAANLVHSHTWYANLGGHLAQLCHGIPHVATVHSLEPMRPWKAEQLGGGYAVSSFAERTGLEGADAIIAVSAGMRRDLLGCYPAIDPQRVSVIHNGIDTDEYRPDPDTDVLERCGIDPAAPDGRVRRPDHAPEGSRASARRGRALRPGRPARARRRLARHARDRRRNGDADRTPALDAWRSRVAPGPVGPPRSDPAPQPRSRVRLPLGLRAARDRQPRGDGLRDARRRDRHRRHPRGRRRRTSPGCSSRSSKRNDGSHEPVDPAAFATDIASRVNRLLADPEHAKALGRAGRLRAVEQFSWAAIAARTVKLYRSLL